MEANMEDGMDEQYTNPPQSQGQLPTCPLCGNQSFRREQGRLDSRWGFTTHKLTLLICNRCQFVMQFYDGHSVWDFE